MSKTNIMNKAGIAVLVVILLLLPMVVESIYWVSVLAIILINILLTSSLRTIMLLDLLSLGHVGFALFAAYASALLVMKVGLSFWVSLLIAGAMSGLLAFALGYPFLRLKGMYFAILTLLTGETLRLLAYYWDQLTGGVYGLLDIPPPSPIRIAGIGLIDFTYIHNYYYVIVIIVLISLLALYKLEHSHLGFKWRAIRDSDNLALAVGINIAWYKTVNFAIACFFAGIAGALYAHFQRSLSAEPSSNFGVWSSLLLLVYVAIGGVDKFAGPIVGTLVLMLVTEFTRPLREYQPMLVGALAILVVLFMREGIITLPSKLKLLLRYGSKKARMKKRSV